MIEEKAKQIGSRLTLISILIGLLIAYLLMSMIANDFFWMKSFGFIPNILVGVAGMLLAGFYFGKRAGKEIIIEKRNSFLTSYLYANLTLWAGTICGSLVGVFQNLNTPNPFHDFLVRVLLDVSIFGCLPVFIVSLGLGMQIKRQGKKISGRAE